MNKSLRRPIVVTHKDGEAAFPDVDQSAIRVTAPSD